MIVWEAGGLKMTEMVRLTMAENDAFGNSGPGLWLDIDCLDATIRHNRVYWNSYFGINFEICHGAKIYGNVVWENGYGFPDWGWGAGILALDI